ncbi:MAG: phage tail protein [Ornithinimicrobium sp.]
MTVPASAASPPRDPDPPVTTCWGVDIGKTWLGTFMSCEGLGLEVVLEQREEGGNNDFVWQIPTRIKYGNIKLSRPVCPETKNVIDWLSELMVKVEPQTATIRVMTDADVAVVAWSLKGVIPVRWTGPSLNADSPKVATETIELAHHGFTSVETSP